MAATQGQTERARPMKVRVREGRIGYYNAVRWRSGQVFELNSPKDFSEKWMEKVAPATRVDRPMSGKVALDKAVEAIRGGGSSLGLITDPGTDPADIRQAVADAKEQQQNERAVI